MVDYAKFGGRIDNGSQDSTPDYNSFGGRVEINPEQSATGNILQQVRNQPEQVNSPDTEGYILNGLRNFGAGALNNAKSMAQMVPDLSKITPPALQNALLYKQGERPFDNFDPYKAMGTTDQPFSGWPSGEHTLAGAEQAAGNLFFPGKLAQEAAKPFMNVFKKINPEEIAHSVQAHHDALESEASNMFDHVGNEAEKRGINKVPVDQDLIEQAKSSGYFPKTKASKDLINRASNGDYQAIRDLQSDLGKRARTRLASEFAAENNQGEEMEELRDAFNGQIRNHFKNTGNEDLANNLDTARFKWKNLKDMYYNKNLPVGVRKLVDSESREIPNNIQNLFSKISKPMNRLRDENPFIQNSLNHIQRREHIINALKSIGKPIATTIGTGLGIGTSYEIINALRNLSDNRQGNQ